MGWLIELFVNAGVIMLLAYLLPSVTVRNYGTALLVALIVGLLNATLGALLRFPLNLVTFWLLSFFVRLLITAVMIKLADKFFKGFEVKTFTAAVIIACTMAVVGSLVSYVVYSPGY